MAECAMSVIKQLFRPVDVMEIKTIEDPDLKPLYGLRHLKLGAFAEAHDRRDKYWYWAGLKKYMTYVFGFTTSASKLTWDVCSWVQTGRNNVRKI